MSTASWIAFPAIKGYLGLRSFKPLGRTTGVSLGVEEVYGNLKPHCRLDFSVDYVRDSLRAAIR